MRPCLRWSVVGMVAILIVAPLGNRESAAQVGPEESAKQAKAADGLTATLWAAEPMVINPTSMDIDSRGRVWVAEGLNYRLTRGRNQRFTRIEEADKIKILEDTDQDGQADKVTVFADQIFPVPMGLAVEEQYDEAGKYVGCKVYVGNSPNLLVLEDTDGDDQADVRYPLLTGFGGIDSDHGVHGMTLFLDGKLYFTHGDGCCSVQPDRSERSQNFDVVDKSGRRVSSDQLANTLRVNRDGTMFETLADRQRNNYETALNSFGNIFTSDNDDDGNRGCRVIWVMDGGTYGYRTPGSPRHWGEEVPGNVPKLVGTGNGSPCGIMVYEGALLGPEYQGALFEADAGTRQINFFPITRRGAAFRTNYKVLLSSDDPWFRPVDQAAAPDGSVFVADWYDAGVGGHAFSDQTTGRIYRVAPKEAQPTLPKYDFATADDLIEALQSPVVATQDAARRRLIAMGEDADAPLVGLYQNQDAPAHLRARALWTLMDVRHDPLPAINALDDPEPTIRELGVRILGRDVSREGSIEYQDEAKASVPAAMAHLDALLPLADDPDAGVRRELILALRYLPTDLVGDSLRKLAASWDGQDRWYLEALGLALRDREPEFLSAAIFDGSLYGPMDLDALGQTPGVALPPYFPTDRNEAFIAADDPELPPANALSKTLGLMWEIHRPEVLPLLARILPRLGTPDLQQAADDVLGQVSDPAGAIALADLLFKVGEPGRQRQILQILARRLDGPWSAARNDPKLVQAIEAALTIPETQADAVALAAATGDSRYAGTLRGYLTRADAAPVEVRIAAVEALGRLRAPQTRELLLALIEHAKSSNSSDPVAEAAMRTLPAFGEAREAMADQAVASMLPLGLRREALRAAIQDDAGTRRILELAEQGKLPEDLRVMASTALSVHPNRELRDRAGQILPLGGAAGGRTLPPFYELVRRDGDVERGREVFFREGANGCASCHRVQGRGQWVGPDLSTIGTKYGKDGLLTAILSPSEAIGYNFRSYVVALDDGRVLTGLPVEETAARLVLKTSEGERIRIRPEGIEEKRLSDVSLMPEGLAQTINDQEIADLLAFLSTLRQPVSIVGEFQAVGPLAEAEGHPAVEPGARLDFAQPVRDASGQARSWSRVRADAEGRIDLSALAGADSRQAAYVHTPIESPAQLTAQLVVETGAEIRIWLDGKPLELPRASSKDAARSVEVQLGRGAHDLLIRVPGGANSSLVATLVAEVPLNFRPVEVALSNQP